jgi:hypothetical protein
MNDFDVPTVHDNKLKASTIQTRHDFPKGTVTVP